MISAAPLLERKGRLRDLLSNAGTPLQYSDHQIGWGPEFYAKACELSLEGIISKRADASYSPGNRRADEFAASGNDIGVAIWRIIDAIGQLPNTTPPGPVR